jgi:hypothetical protein
MANVTGPCLSLLASGTIGDYVTFRNGRGGPVAERKPEHGFLIWPRTTRQGNQRDIIKCLGQAWRYLSFSDVESWQVAAHGSKNTGYSAYVSSNARAFRAGSGMSFAHPASFSDSGMNVTATGTLGYGRSLTLEFLSPDPSDLFFLVIGHFSPTAAVGGFNNIKALHFWRPDPKYLPDIYPLNPPHYTEFHREPGEFRWTYYHIIESINYIPWAVGLRSGYLFSGCIDLTQ